jgi:hypothetical protein
VVTVGGSHRAMPIGCRSRSLDDGDLKAVAVASRRANLSGGPSCFSGLLLTG